MFISNLSINEFRLFHNNNFKLGEYITAIAGFNATGKSTVLALLGHCGEMKKYKPLLQPRFRAELSEIIKFSEIHDNNIKDIGTITFSELPTLLANGVPYPPTLSYRSTRQGGKRYRIIPKKTAQWNSSSKINWPTLYLGLGRLYPLGESIKVDKTNPIGKLTVEDINFITSNSHSILNLQCDIRDITIASISETNKKKAVGLNTDNYDYLCNSAGQDNLGQILMSILSFRKLKERLGSDWCGGLLVVDEIDAALHPSAQNKLVKFLYDQAVDLGMQIVFTTHSLGLLDFITTKTDHNNSDTINNYELIHLTNGNGPIVVDQNPPFNSIYMDLMATYSTLTQRKISVFSEDNEARFVIRKLLEDYTKYFDLLDVSFGCDDLLKLLTSDYNNLSKYIYILDGDVEDKKIEDCSRKINPLKQKCIIKLPGNKRPEQVFWEYINDMRSDHDFLTEFGRIGYNKRNIQESGPFSDIYKGTDIESVKYKLWFNDNTQLINHVFEYWRRDNNTIIDSFIQSFKDAYGWVARRCFIPSIP